jgi:hypothetical protein
MSFKDSVPGYTALESLGICKLRQNMRNRKAVQVRIKYCSIVMLGIVSLLFMNCGGDAQSDPNAGAEMSGASWPSDSGHELADLRVVPIASGIGVTESGMVEIRMNNADDLYGLHVALRFNPDLLEVQDINLELVGVQIAPGVLPAPDFTVLNTADNEQGMIEYAVTQLNPRQPAQGDGVVAVIRFQGVGSGVSPLTLSYAKLSNPDGEAMPVQIVDATLKID